MIPTWLQIQQNIRKLTAQPEVNSLYSRYVKILVLGQMAESGTSLPMANNKTRILLLSSHAEGDIHALASSYFHLATQKVSTQKMFRFLLKNQESPKKRDTSKKSQQTLVQPL